MRKSVAIVLVVVPVAIALVLIPHRTGPAANNRPAPEQGHPAPDFALTSVTGSRIHLASLRGKVVLINFWATWCGPCRSEMPLLASWYRHVAPGRFVVLGVDTLEPKSDVAAFMRRLHVTYPVVLDENASVGDRYRAAALPESFLLDSNGIIRAVHYGALDRQFLEKHIIPALRTDGA